jgi:hypothetical protein
MRTFWRNAFCPNRIRAFEHCRRELPSKSDPNELNSWMLTAGRTVFTKYVWLEWIEQLSVKLTKVRRK